LIKNWFIPFLEHALAHVSLRGKRKFVAGWFTPFEQRKEGE